MLNFLNKINYTILLAIYMKDFIQQAILNFPGFKTKRKIVVIHSDDWGSIRMPSIKTQNRLNSHDLIDANNGYSHYDTLASVEDLEALFKVLKSVKDKHDNPAVFTANCVLVNPDFERIKKSGFEDYFHEPLSTTFSNYNNDKALKLWDQGIDEGLFLPQFHGREHLNFPFWMHLLKSGHSGVLEAFDQKVFGVGFLNLPFGQTNLQRAWDIIIPNSQHIIEKAILDGLNLFKEKFGYESKSVIAPNYTWSKVQEELLLKNNVIAFQGMLKQRVSEEMGRYSYENRFSSYYVNKSDGAFQRRNIFLEPSLRPKQEWVKNALKRMSISFMMNKPAIIGTHRVNYIGSLNVANRDQNLRLLAQLLGEIVKKWPDVEFLNADQLAILQMKKFKMR